MAWITQKAGSGPLLPKGGQTYITNRLSETAGIAIIAVAVAYGVALASFASADPSLNSAASGPIQNLLGSPGAIVSDVALQSFGLGAWLPGFALFAWGFLLLRKAGLSHLWLRIVLSICALIALSVSATIIKPYQSWPLASGLGGVSGEILLERTVLFLQNAGAPKAFFNHITIAAIIALPGIAAFVFSLGLPTSDWQKVTRALMWINAKLGAYILKGAHHISAHNQNDDYDNLVDDARRTTSTGPRARKTERTAIKPRPKKKDLIAPKVPKAKTGRKAEAQRQRSLDLGTNGEYKSPPLDLLDTPDPSRSDNAPTPVALEQNAAMLSGVLEDFGIRGEIVKVRPGPVITLYELEPAPGTKSSRVIGLSDDIARSMSAISVRVATVPGRNVIGIELPNQSREMVHLRELLASADFEKSKGALTMALGKNIGGVPVNVDLARMPHLLIAGTTGSGKSVGLNAMILSLLYQNSPEQCRFIMIDPKMLELSVYDNIPHLLSPVVTDPSKAVVALKWTVREMEERYRAMSQMGVRNITGYNQRLIDATKRGEVMTRRVQTGFDEAGKPIFEEQPLSMDPLPYIVVVVDEMADLMLVAGKDVEAAIQRLAQMARAAGIHIIMATQRPSVDVITGTIKANFPTRVSFQVTSKIDSRTILGEQGAERLLGQGDMLYMAGGGQITRIHAPFVSDEEVEEVVNFLKDQGAPDYLDEVTEEPITPDMTGPVAGGGTKDDELYDQAVALIAREGKASTSFIQRHLQIGYNRAARIIERMEAEGVVSKANRVGRREVLIGDVSAQAS